MKSLLLLWISVVRIVSCEWNELCVALHEISSKFFLSQYDNLRVVYATDIHNQGHVTDLLGDFLLLTGESAKVIVDDAKLMKPSKSRGFSPGIIFMDNIKSFREHLGDKISLNQMKFRKFNVIVLSDGLINEIEEIFNVFWKNWIFNLNLIARDGQGKIIMMTFFPFDESCGDEITRKVVINEFNNVTKMWKSSNYYPTKVKDIKNCAINVGTITTNIPSVILNTTNGVQMYSGFEVDIIREIAKRMNFKIFFNGFISTGSFLENGTITSDGLFPSVLAKKNDISIGSLSLQLDRAFLMSETKSFISVPVIMVVPPGRNLSAFQKLIKPFSYLAWILLSTSFISTCFFIIFLRYSSKELYNFVIGKNIKNPILSLLVGIFGLSSHVLPKRNFSRFILMQFLLLCLVIRSIYQGKLFTMLQSELKEKNVETIDEVYEREMTFYTYESMYRRSGDFKYYQNMKMIKIVDMETYMNQTINPEFNGVVFNYIIQPLYLNGLHYKEYSYLIAKEVFVRNQFVFYLQQNHFLVDFIDSYIELFCQSGLIDKWTSTYVNQLFLHPPEPEKLNEPLSFRHLAAVFYVLLIGQGISIVVFIIERNFHVVLVLGNYLRKFRK